MQGIPKFVDYDRRCGFISRERGEDVFVHVSKLQPSGTTLTAGLQEGRP
jgi:cold shock CspA family protein